MVSVIPALTAAAIDEPLIERSLTLGKNFAEFIERRGLGGEDELRARNLLRGEPGSRRLLLSVVGPDPPGENSRPALRSGPSSCHRTGCGPCPPTTMDHPYRLDVNGSSSQVDYEPAEIHHPDVRRELQLARPTVVPAELPAHHRPGALLRVSSATTSASSTRSAQAAACRSTPSPGTCRTGSSPCSCPAPTAGGPASGRQPGCSTTPSGKTTWCSASTSTATTAPGSALHTRPAGRA